jgi:PEP-CTERM motif
MRQAGLALVAITAFMGLGVPVAEAGITCKVIPSWCPGDRSTKGRSNEGLGTTSVHKTSVPEPGTLMLLAAGASAAGVAVFRRRKNKNKKD